MCYTLVYLCKVFAQVNVNKLLLLKNTVSIINVFLCYLVNLPMPEAQKQKKYDFDDKDFCDLLKLMSKAIDKIGFHEVKNNISSLLIQSASNQDSCDRIVEYILDCVCLEWAEFRVRKGDLFKHRKRGELTNARRMAMILIKENVKINDQQLGEFFGGRVRQVSYKTYLHFQNMDPTNKVDSKFLNKYNTISFKVRKYCNELEQKQKAGTAITDNITANG